ncbi:MAG: hypothetical protein A2X49_01235 [Lentisphaerae bacterium GWF2_52_8]|nr:MAG: hypothetical protein A2X49_01235 [Lentisphaerae bacterium GWF2_52_8]
MKRMRALIFSKHRTLQLKSLLVSLRCLTDLPIESVRVIYVPSETISYTPLMGEFPCKFIRQTVFLENVREALSGGSHEYVLFMVDDLIYREETSFAQILGFMDSHQDVSAFSPRMGRNIESQPMPSFEDCGNGILSWNTSRSLGKHWNYFWEVSSSIYRRKTVEEYLSHCRAWRETFPNPFEWHYYSCLPNTRSRNFAKLYLSLRYPFRRQAQRMACFEKSRCCTQGVNLVAERESGVPDRFSCEELHRKMMDGYVIDFRPLRHADISAPNAGAGYFSLVKKSELLKEGF